MVSTHNGSNSALISRGLILNGCTTACFKVGTNIPSVTSCLPDPVWQVLQADISNQKRQWLYKLEVNLKLPKILSTSSDWTSQMVFHLIRQIGTLGLSDLTTANIESKVRMDVRDFIHKTFSMFTTSCRAVYLLL